jgi:hypothetical protein
VFFGSIPTLLLLNAIGNRLLQGDYLIVFLLATLLVAGVFLLYCFRNRIFALYDRLRASREKREDDSENASR